LLKEKFISVELLKRANKVEGLSLRFKV